MKLELFDTLHYEVGKYIESTYEAHYVNDDGIQTADYIESLGLGEGFYLGNALKYVSRYGRKEGYNDVDLYKAIHYLYMELAARR